MLNRNYQSVMVIGCDDTDALPIFGESRRYLALYEGCYFFVACLANNMRLPTISSLDRMFGE